MLSVRLDGNDVVAEQGMTLLDVIRREGIRVPTLCHLKGIIPRGACRLCLVEVKGMGRPAPSCCTLVEDGMDVTTGSERIEKLRKTNLELLFAERNHTCPVCVSSGSCELQKAAEELGFDHTAFQYLSPVQLVDISHERFGMDHNRCILCGRCVRTCDQVEGARTIDVRDRGIRSRIIFDLDVPWGESVSCTSCGKCVEVCPTGAMFRKGATVASQVKDPEVIGRITGRRPREHQE